MSVGVAAGFTAEAFDAFLASRDEPAWLTERRRAAWQLFEELPMPSRSDEEWMRTDIRLFRLDRFGFPSDGATAAAPPATALLREGVELGGATRCSRQPAHCSRISTTSSRSKACCSAASTSWSLKHGDLVAAPFISRRRSGLRPFRRAARRRLGGGTLLYVPKGVTIDQPLHTLSAISDGGVDFGHPLVVLDEGAEATLLSETAGGGEQRACTAARSS